MAGTAANAGRKGFLSWTTGAGSSVATTKVGALQNWSITQNRPPIEATSFDSSGYEEVIPAGGVLGWTVSATLFSYSSDTVQKASRKQLVQSSPAVFYVNLYPHSTSKTFRYTGKVEIQDISLKAGTRDAVMYDVTFKGNGKLTYTS